MKYVSKLRVPKKIAWVHNDFDVLHWTRFCFYGDAELRCMREFDTVVCVSEQVRRGVLNQVGDPGNLVVLYNPMDADNIRSMSGFPVRDARQARG